MQHEEKRREVEEQKALSIFDNVNADVAKRPLMRLTMWKQAEIKQELTTLDNFFVLRQVPGKAIGKPK